MLVYEKIEANNAAATARLATPNTAANAAVAVQLQLRHEATVRAHARLDQLSKRAQLGKMLAALSHIKFPQMHY